MTNNKVGKQPLKVFVTSTIAASLALVLSSCADDGATGNNSGIDVGFNYEADQAAVDSVLEDLDPITITYQSLGSSAESPQATGGLQFKELVEERSKGKISVDLVWGRAIAEYDEVHDALADGRLDMAYTLPSYDPSAFPIVNNLALATAEIDASPQVGSLVANAVANDLAWENEDALREYEEKDLVPLTPLVTIAGYFLACTEPTVSLEDLGGKQVRTGSTAHTSILEDLGATPVSLSAPEQFDALQRGTIDCNLGALTAAVEGGTLEVASDLSFSAHNLPIPPGAVLAGSSFNDMPLAYQQIIFDSNALAMAGTAESVISGNLEGFTQAKANGGQVVAFSGEVDDQILSSSQDLIEAAISNGDINENIQSHVQVASQEWFEEIAELGYVDEGPAEEFDAWYDPNTDYDSYAKFVYENGQTMEHRP